MPGTLYRTVGGGAASDPPATMSRSKQPADRGLWDCAVCAARRDRGEGLCYHHDPGQAPARADAARRGAETRAQRAAARAAAPPERGGRAAGGAARMNVDERRLTGPGGQGAAPGPRAPQGGMGAGQAARGPLGYESVEVGVARSARRDVSFGEASDIHTPQRLCRCLRATLQP